jgi:hypothetical protein
MPAASKVKVLIKVSLNTAAPNAPPQSTKASWRINLSDVDVAPEQLASFKTGLDSERLDGYPPGYSQAWPQPKPQRANEALGINVGTAHRVVRPTQPEKTGQDRNVPSRAQAKSSENEAPAEARTPTQARRTGAAGPKPQTNKAREVRKAAKKTTGKRYVPNH